MCQPWDGQWVPPVGALSFALECCPPSTRHKGPRLSLTKSQEQRPLVIVGPLKNTPPPPPSCCLPQSLSLPILKVKGPSNKAQISTGPQNFSPPQLWGFSYLCSPPEHVLGEGEITYSIDSID